MPQTIVIAGSASLRERAEYWKAFWEAKDYQVLDYPKAIARDNFLRDYPDVHRNFFRQIEQTELFFVMNEDKNGLTGYIGAETFAELTFALAQNLLHDRKIEILLLKMPAAGVQSHQEIELWLELKWIKLAEFN